MTAFHRLLSRNLRSLRDSYGWSREKLSDVTGISTNFLSEIESGTKFPRPENLVKLCDALRVQPADLFRSDQTCLTAGSGRLDLHLAARLKEDFGLWVDNHLEESDRESAAESPS